MSLIPGQGCLFLLVYIGKASKQYVLLKKLSGMQQMPNKQPIVTKMDIQKDAELLCRWFK